MNKNVAEFNTDGKNFLALPFVLIQLHATMSGMVQKLRYTTKNRCIVGTLEKHDQNQ